MDSDSKGYYDTHSHLADPRLDGSREQFLQEAKDKGIAFHLQGGVGPEDWQRQLDLQDKYPQILLCFGIHPYWVADRSERECENALDQLARWLPRAAALGELGLDLRPKIVKESLALQLSVFEDQLELAELSKKPCVFHLVQAFDFAQKIFATFGVPSPGGFVHSFNGSTSEAEFYLAQGLHLSVGGPVARPENKRLHQAVKMIPMESLLLETDSPDQPPPRFQGQLNRPESLWDVAEAVAKIKGLTGAEVLDKSTENLKKLLQ